MYILIELVPVAAGTGFGVFCGGLLGLALLFIMAQYAMTWLLAPVAITMTLLQMRRFGGFCRRCLLLAWW